MYGREHGSDSLREAERKNHATKTRSPLQRIRLTLSFDTSNGYLLSERVREREQLVKKSQRIHNKIIHTKTMFRSSLLTQPTPTTKEARKRL